MSSYEYLVIDPISDIALGIFDELDNALIFISAYYNKYFNEKKLKLIIVRQEKE